MHRRVQLLVAFRGKSLDRAGPWCASLVVGSWVGTSDGLESPPKAVGIARQRVCQVARAMGHPQAHLLSPLLDGVLWQGVAWMRENVPDNVKAQWADYETNPYGIPASFQAEQAEERARKCAWHRARDRKCKDRRCTTCRPGPGGPAGGSLGLVEGRVSSAKNSERARTGSGPGAPLQRLDIIYSVPETPEGAAESTDEERGQVSPETSRDGGAS